MDLSGFVESFLLLHWTVATVTDIPELMLHEEEGEAIASSVAKLLKFYDVPVLNEKMAAWTGLAMCLSQVYGRRAVAIYRRKKAPPERTGEAVLMRDSAGGDIPVDAGMPPAMH